MSNSSTVECTKSGKKLDSAEDVADILAQIHDKEDQIETLKLEGNSYGVEPLREIGQAVQACDNLKNLLLNDMFISRLKDEIPKALELLLGGVTASQAQIETLNLSDNAIGPVTMPSLLPFLQSYQCSSLEKLYMNNCGLGIKGGSMLASILPLLENLTELVLGRNRLEVAGILDISQALCKLTNLERLEIPQNGTKEAAIVSLAQAIKMNPKLKILNLNDNVLTSTAQELADAIKDLKHLESLNLGECLLKTNGAIIILMALQELCKCYDLRLREVILSGNEIGKDAEDTIFLTIEMMLIATEGQAKIRVDLSLNNFGEALVQKLKRHFGSELDLVIEEDQGSENEEEPQEEYDEEDQNGDTSSGQNRDSIDALLDNPNDLVDIESLAQHFGTNYDLLCQKFLQIAQEGYEPSERKLTPKAAAQISILVKVGKAIVTASNGNHFHLINQLLVTCNVLKGEDKSVSKKIFDLTGPLMALVLASKEYTDKLHKRCIENLVLKKVKELGNIVLELDILPLIYRF